MVMDVNWTYCGDHFAIYTYVESLCHTPEINIMVYVNFTLKNPNPEQLKRGRKAEAPATPNKTLAPYPLSPHSGLKDTSIQAPGGPRPCRETAGAVLPSSCVMRNPNPDHIGSWSHSSLLVESIRTVSPNCQSGLLDRVQPEGMYRSPGSLLKWLHGSGMGPQSLSF